MKHLPFQSIYKKNFEVVEQRINGEFRYPHDDQLPIIWRALDMEFRDPLPARLARLDHRADGFEKLTRNSAAMLYCGIINGARADGVRLLELADEHLVSQVAVVQRVTRSTPKGREHTFRFYGGPNFQPELRLAGKRVVFAEHVVERFSQRVPNMVGEDLMNLLLTVHGSPMISMALEWGHGLVVPHGQSLLAFTYKETEDEFFLTTCLTVNELGTLKHYMPPLIYNWHYGTAYAPPPIRNWVPTLQMKTMFEAWQNKTPLAPEPPRRPVESWHRMAQWIKNGVCHQGHGPGSRIAFLDNIPGPCMIRLKPGEQELQYDELADYKQWQPETDWDSVFAERNRFMNGECLPHQRVA